MQSTHSALVQCETCLLELAQKVLVTLSAHSQGLKRTMWAVGKHRMEQAPHINTFLRFSLSPAQEGDGKEGGQESLKKQQGSGRAVVKEIDAQGKKGGQIISMQL